MPVVKILFEGAENKVRCEDDLSFSEFDVFIRQRFGISEASRIRYCNEDDEGGDN